MRKQSAPQPRHRYELSEPVYCSGDQETGEAEGYGAAADREAAGRGRGVAARAGARGSQEPGGPRGEGRGVRHEGGVDPSAAPVAPGDPGVDQGPAAGDAAEEGDGTGAAADREDCGGSAARGGGEALATGMRAPPAAYTNCGIPVSPHRLDKATGTGGYTRVPDSSAYSARRVPCEAGVCRERGDEASHERSSGGFRGSGRRRDVGRVFRLAWRSKPETDPAFVACRRRSHPSYPAHEGSANTGERPGARPCGGDDRPACLLLPGKSRDPPERRQRGCWRGWWRLLATTHYCHPCE